MPKASHSASVNLQASRLKICPRQAQEQISSPSQVLENYDHNIYADILYMCVYVCLSMYTRYTQICDPILMSAFWRT